MRQVYRGTFRCDLCKADRTFAVFGLQDNPDEKTREDVQANAKHWHWVARHRLCAVCGQYTKDGEFASAVNDGRIKVHSDYTNQVYQKVESGDIGQLLFVHPGCIDASVKSW